MMPRAVVETVTVVVTAVVPVMDTDVGETAQVASGAFTEQVNATFPVKPPDGVTVTT
jgi:hypothetical protein